MNRAGFQTSERMTAFEQCVYACSTSTRMPSRGAFALDGAFGQQPHVGGERRAPVDAEHVADARDDEKQPNVRGFEDVPE